MNTENGKAKKGRRQNADYQGHAAVRIGGVAAYCHAAGCQHGNEKAGQRPTYTGKEVCSGRNLISYMCVRAESGNHTPIGNIMHGIGDAVEEIDHRKKPDKFPAGQF